MTYATVADYVAFMASSLGVTVEVRFREPWTVEVCAPGCEALVRSELRRLLPAVTRIVVYGDPLLFLAAEVLET